MFLYLITTLANFIENLIRLFISKIADYLPSKVIRDDKGVPFLYRYHLFMLSDDGPGLCIHRFINSDPDRGYHDHPWPHAISFILCGNYTERIIDKESECGYISIPRNRWTFNFIRGAQSFHRVMLDQGKDAWTLFAFQKRSKTWGMISLDGTYKLMSSSISDNDGGWWKSAKKGLNIHNHIEHPGKVIATVDIIVATKNKILLIKRGKDPFKGKWAFPGGRIEAKDTDIISAAYRELKEETNLSNVTLKYIKTIGNSIRDPRGFCLTNIYLVILDEIPDGVRAGDDAVDYEWFDLYNLPEMAFDHKEILDEILDKFI